MIRTVAVSFMILFSITTAGYSDVVFEMSHVYKDQQKNNRTKGFVKGSNIKMDSHDNSDKLENSMIYRGDRDIMIMVDHNDKSYVVMDKQTMEKLSGKLNNAMAQMEEAMKNVPPEQREMMKKMMKDKMPGMSGKNHTEPVLKKSGSGTVNGYSCTKYDIYKGNELIRKHCITSWNNIKGGQEISTVMLEMSQFMDEMTRTFADAAGPFGSSLEFEMNVFNKLKEMNGFPVKSVELDNGKQESESVFKSSQITTVDSAVFDPPSGYNRQNIEFE